MGLIWEIERGIPAKALVFVSVVKQTEDEFVLTLPSGYTVNLKPLINRRISFLY
jgi:hypothetical protein